MRTILALALCLLVAVLCGLPLEAYPDSFLGSPEKPYDSVRLSWILCALDGVALLALGAAALIALPQLRRSRLAGPALALLFLAGFLRYPSASIEYGRDSIKRLAFWRNGSELYEASPQYMVWAGAFADRLAADTVHAKEAYFVHVRIGEYFLRVGRRQESIEQFERALERLEDNREELDVSDPGLYLKKKLEILRWLGISNLRAGEIDHCIAMVSPESCIFPLRGGGIWAEPAGAIKAEGWLTQLLELDPKNPGGRYLLNIAHMAQGTFPHGVPREYLLPESAYADSAPAPRFTNVGAALKVNDSNVSGGAIMDDFDNDGFLDLVTTCLRTDTNMIFHHNNGDGTFTDWTEEVGLLGQKGGLNTVQVDYDNDGWLDIFVARGAWLADQGRFPNSLLHNRGDGTFEDVTKKAGLYAPAWPCLAIAWCDYDKDGDVDLYVGNERLRTNLFAPCQLFRNDGDGTFTDVAEAAGVTNLRFARGVSWGDYDRDGDWDLYVSNIGDENRLYQNQGDGRFRDVAPKLGVHQQGSNNPRKQRSFQSWFFDANNDGWLDIFSSSYPLDGGGVSVDGAAVSLFGEEPTQESCRLWLNDKSGGFLDATPEYGLRRTVSAMGANLCDVDNDGWMDFYLGTGGPAYEVFLPNMLFMNRGGTSFAEGTVASGLGHLQKGHAVAFGDVDNDGDQDLFHQLGGWYVDDRYYNALFRNDGPPRENHWLTIRPRGRRSDRFALGATVTAVTQENGAERRICATVGSGASFGGNSLQTELGLGPAQKLLRLEIHWPTTGVTQILEEPPMDCVIQVEEGAEGWTVIPARAIELATRA